VTSHAHNSTRGLRAAVRRDVVAHVQRHDEDARAAGRSREPAVEHPTSSTAGLALEPGSGREGLELVPRPHVPESARSSMRSPGPLVRMPPHLAPPLRARCRLDEVDGLRAGGHARRDKVHIGAASARQPPQGAPGAPQYSSQDTNGSPSCAVAVACAAAPAAAGRRAEEIGRLRRFGRPAAAAGRWAAAVGTRAAAAGTRAAVLVRGLRCCTRAAAAGTRLRRIGRLRLVRARLAGTGLL